MARVNGLLAAICKASASTAPSSAASGTTRLISPSSRARTAATRSPVKSISIAALRPTARLSATIGVEQNRPIFTPGVANSAVSAATARSQLATNWHPAAVATPCTRAITGLPSRMMRVISAEHWANSARIDASDGSARTSRKSCPAQNAGPAPAITTTRTAASAAAAARASASAAISAEDSALRASGRFSVNHATPSAGWSVKRIGGPEGIGVRPCSGCATRDAGRARRS